MTCQGFAPAPATSSLSVATEMPEHQRTCEPTITVQTPPCTVPRTVVGPLNLDLKDGHLIA